MSTRTRSRSVAEVRALDPAQDRAAELARALEVEALSATAAILGAIERSREERHLSIAAVAEALGKQRTAVSRLVNDADESNPTMRTLTELLWAVGLHADVIVRPRTDEDDRVLEVTTEL